ncbi:PilZ domain-containing protein [Thermodesulfobacteriota bacterium]
MDEKRKDPRIKVDWPVVAILGNRSIEGVAKNITLKGIFLRCKEPLPLKDNFRLSIFTPNKKTMDVVGKVAWSDIYALDDDSVPVCVGLSFVKISTEDLDSLKKIVHNRIEIK